MNNQEQMSELVEKRQPFLLNIRAVKKRFKIKYNPLTSEILKGVIVAYWVSYKKFDIGIVKGFNNTTNNAIIVLPIRPQSIVFGSEKTTFLRNIQGIFLETKA